MNDTPLIQTIKDIDSVICRNIEKFSAVDRQLTSENLLSQFRNFAEDIIMLVYYWDKDKMVDPLDYDKRKLAIKDLVNVSGRPFFLIEFHNFLQASVSHYTPSPDGAERLMLKYYEYLLKIKKYMKDTFSIELLHNIDDFPISIDTQMFPYYQKIAERINHSSEGATEGHNTERVYIQKKKPFYVNGEVYYEISFCTAFDINSKFNRLIAFTHYDIMPYYAVRFKLHEDVISMIGKDIPILVIDSWRINIRPCEFMNLGKIVGLRGNVNSNSREYRKLMEYMTSENTSLNNLINCNRQKFLEVKNIVSDNLKYATPIFDILNKCRSIIRKDKPGANVLRYLLSNMNNTIIKSQYFKESCSLLSNLYLKYQCIPFDKMPFCTSLSRHNPRMIDLLRCIPTENREHEFLAKYIFDKTYNEGEIFTSLADLSKFGDLDLLVTLYHSFLYIGHDSRKLVRHGNFIYQKEFVDDTLGIIKELKRLNSLHIDNYGKLIEQVLSSSSYSIDSIEKKKVLLNLFAHSKVALIYGPAGTGKTTLINHIAHCHPNIDKMFVANTHPAVENIKRRVSCSNCRYSTIASLLSTREDDLKCDILFVDECSTITNHDFLGLINKIKYKAMVLVGDVLQIEAIGFGNWFEIARKFVSKNAVFDLNTTYRTHDDKLLKLWNKVRFRDQLTVEWLVHYRYSSAFDESIFSRDSSDEIILCLNYDGLYGINNINRILQCNNSNKPFFFRSLIYKIGDPVLFNEVNRFNPLIHNNSKGYILNIEDFEDHVRFTVELDFALDEFESCNYDFKLQGLSNGGNSIISFDVNKNASTDDDKAEEKSMIPFQVAYAISIHKAQGLEYDSVKVVITDEVHERISLNIFYTAITRCRERLKIYWSPEAGDKIIKSFSIKDQNRNISMLRQLLKTK